MVWLLSKLYQKYVYYMVKWFTHMLTGKCAIERILESNDLSDGDRALKVEKQLALSKSSIKNLVDNFGTIVTGALKTLASLGGSTEVFSKEVAIKNVQSVKVFAFSSNILRLESTMVLICDYRSLIREVEKLRITKFDESNDSHVRMLKNIWRNLKLEDNGDNEFTRTGPHWKDLGFQGEDPVTDLRGMGILGLANLNYFAASYTDKAKQLLIRSHNPTIGYSFAITVIDLTNLCYQLLLFGTLKHIFYYQEKDKLRNGVDFFEECFVQIFELFDAYWIESKPESIMDYGVIRKNFEEEIRASILSRRKIVMKDDQL